MEVTFPFVVGSGRSGTTLVRTMLDSHPELAMPGESHFIVRLARQLRPFAPTAFVDAALAEPFVRGWGLVEDEVRGRFADSPPADYPAAVRLLYACYARAQGKPRYGDKTPRYVRQIPALAEMFAESRFVHVIRDGRDVAASLLEAAWFPGDLARAARYWKKAVEEGRRSGRALGGRYLELRYEALVADPEPELRRLCQFIGLDYAPAMLDYRTSAERAIRMALHPQDHGSLRLAPTPGLRDWRRDMDPLDSAVVWLLAGDLLSELGYQPGEGRIPVQAHARALRIRAKALARRLCGPARRALRR